MKSCALAIFAAAMISSSLTSRPAAQVRLSRTLAANSSASCGSRPIWRRTEAVFQWRMSVPSISTLPFCGSYRRSSSTVSVDLPMPDGPTTATCSRGVSARSSPWKMERDSVSYEKCRSRKCTAPSKAGAVLAPLRSMMSGFSSRMSLMRSAEASAFESRPAYLAYSRTGRMEFLRYEMNTSRSPAVSAPASTCRAPCHSTRAVATATSRSIERSSPAASRLVFMSACAAWPSLP